MALPISSLFRRMQHQQLRPQELLNQQTRHKSFGVLWYSGDNFSKSSFHPRSLTANASEKWWLEDDKSFLLGLGNFSGAIFVKLPGGYYVDSSLGAVFFG